MPDTAEVRYLVLADRAVPYLLARVRWPDVAQAISAASPDWLDDPGLFDLPYEPSAVTISFPQAASVAAGWGRRLHAESTEDAASYIRRMPANWSELSPSEKHTWGIESVGRPRAALPIGRLRPSRAKIADSSATARRNGQVVALAGPGGDTGAAANGPVANGRGQLPDVRSVNGNGNGSGATERRRHLRVRLDGRVHIRCEDATITAGLVDLSERGVGCVLPEAPPLVTPGATLGGPFLLEAEAHASRICLDVVGQISWDRSTGAGMRFGVAFSELANGDAEGVRRFLSTATRNRGDR